MDYKSSSFPASLNGRRVILDYEMSESSDDECASDEKSTVISICWDIVASFIRQDSSLLSQNLKYLKNALIKCENVDIGELKETGVIDVMIEWCFSFTNSILKNLLLCFYYISLNIIGGINVLIQEGVFHKLLNNIKYPPCLESVYSLAICTNIIINDKNVEHLLLEKCPVSDLSKIIIHSIDEKGFPRLIVHRYLEKFIEVSVLLCTEMLIIKRNESFIEDIIHLFCIACRSNDNCILCALRGFEKIYTSGNMVFSSIDYDEFPPFFEIASTLSIVEDSVSACLGAIPLCMRYPELVINDIRMIFEIIEGNIDNAAGEAAMKCIYALISNSNDSILSTFVDFDGVICMCKYLEEGSYGIMKQSMKSLFCLIEASTGVDFLEIYSKDLIKSLRKIEIFDNENMIKRWCRAIHILLFRSKQYGIFECFNNDINVYNYDQILDQMMSSPYSEHAIKLNDALNSRQNVSI